MKTLREETGLVGKMIVVWLLVLATACGDDDSGSSGDGGVGDGGVPANNGFVLVTAYNAMSNGVPTTGGSVSATFSLQSSASLCTDMTIGPSVSGRRGP